MSERRKNFRRNLNLGIFVVICLAVLTTLTFRLGEFGLEPEREWVAYFGQDSTVKKDSEIFVSGMKVGRVTKVELYPDEEITEGRHVKVTLAIREDITLWEDAQVHLSSRGLLGRTILELSRGDPQSRVITPDQQIPGIIAKSVFDSLSDVVDENRPAIKRITGRIDTLTEKMEQGTLYKLMVDDSLYRELDVTATKIRTLVEATDSPNSTVGQLFRDQTVFNDIRTSIATLKGFVDDVKAGEGALGAIVYDLDVKKNLTTSIASLSRFAQLLEKGDGTISKLVRDPTVYNSLVKAAESLRNIAGRIEAGEGSVGELFADNGELYRSIRSSAQNLENITTRVQQGRGTLGLLLRDDSLYKELQRTFESFRETGEITRENAPLASLVSFTTLFFNVLN